MVGIVRVALWTGRHMQAQAQQQEEREVTLNPFHEKKRCEVVEAKQHGGLQQSMSNADCNRKECDICGRRFHPDRLEKHSLICAKVASESKRRGVYDSFKHRYKGTNLDSFIKRSIDP
ncbi:zinc finger C2HC domain-containing protein 1C [Oncorhynchus tshawytscha]|uniref:zinc finger C2HC domain-containing protein 1C n=1 Tax=Oncorhynchus tshawytscha TaxID=74940 RepID=UPI000D0A5ACA|nr:zinc finger C2HC domain-containing protein 1C [Oncorhynchus tshawytscha]